MNKTPQHYYLIGTHVATDRYMKEELLPTGVMRKQVTHINAPQYLNGRRIYEHDVIIHVGHGLLPEVEAVIDRYISRARIRAERSA